VNTNPSLDAQISVDRLGPAGIRADLVIVAVMENESRRDVDRLHDTTPRPFKVVARLGKTALAADGINGDFDPEDGESYLSLPDEAVASRVRLDGGMMEFKKNAKAEKSLVEFTCTAISLSEAKSKFLDFALPFLDHQAYVANCPIFVQSIRIEDANNQLHSIDYVSPYRTSAISQHLIEVSKELAPVFAMYREAKNSHSDFYKFLCYHKIMDGLLGTLRTAVNQRARKLNIALRRQGDVVPDDPEIAPIYRDHIGTPIKAFFDNVLTPRFRNAVAHFITKDGSILNLSSPSTMLKHAEIMYVSELCVRTLIESHQQLVSQLNTKTDT
jgi:hypothetical protein